MLYNLLMGRRLLLAALLLSLGSCGLTTSTFQEESESAQPSSIPDIPSMPGSVNDPLFPYYSIFTINSGVIITTYVWYDTISTGLFNSSEPGYTIFYDESSFDSVGLQNQLMINISNDQTGIYHSSDGITDISFYDSANSAFHIYASIEDTFTSIDLSNLDGLILGEFKAVLYNSSNDVFISIAGFFRSFNPNT